MSSYSPGFFNSFLLEGVDGDIGEGEGDGEKSGGGGGIVEDVDMVEVYKKINTSHVHWLKPTLTSTLLLPIYHVVKLTTPTQHVKL